MISGQGNHGPISRLVLAGVLAAALAAGSGPSVLAKALKTGDGILRHDIEVTTVDPAAVQAANRGTNAPNKDLALAPKATERKQRLFLYLVGSGISETTQNEIVYAGARHGYNSIAVAYPNYNAVVPLCASSTDDDCTGKVREEIISGADLTPIVTIAPRDSIEGRLKALLVYLRTTYPAEGWGEFLTGNEVKWEAISVAGHSQGAGHVALLAKRHNFYRAVMLAGVADQTKAGKPAPWLGRPNVTPPKKQYGFNHVKDGTVKVDIAEASWRVIGLQAFGPMTSVDGAKAPYGGSHMLSTAVEPALGTNYHTGIVGDDIMARTADGAPVYEPVWASIIFP